MVLEHLFEVRDAPVLGRRVAEETAFDLVIRAAASHPFERMHGHAPQLVVRAHNRLLEQQQDGVGLGKLRRVAEAAVLGIVRRPNRVQDHVDEPRLELARTAGHAGRRALARIEDAARDLGLAAAVVVRDAHERVRHLVRRQVRAAGQDVAGRREEGGRRPAAHVVALVDVGPHVIVDADGHELAVDDVDHARMRISRFVHHVAPVTPDR